MAGLIPQSFIQDLLARTDIVQVIGERLQLKKAGREYKALSPFTNEKTPSFTVSPQKQFYHCFSSGKHGTAITFLMEYERLTFVEAVEELSRRAGVEVPREGGGGGPAPVMDGPLDALVLADRFFRAELRKHPPAIDYLKKRGITGETAKEFGIGFAPDSWDALTKQFRDPAHAVTAGLLIRKESGGTYDRFRNRIMFPIRDTRGRVVAFGGRTLADDPAKYLNSPETPLFHKGRQLYGLYEARQKAADLAEILVVEGYMDAVMLAQHGIRNVVATLGTATTRDHLTLLYRSTSRIVFCFDGDRAGKSAAWRALEQALPEVFEGRECCFMFLPEGQDPDTLVQEIGADEFRKRAREACPLSLFLLDELESKVELSTPDGRARLAALAWPHIERMRQGVLRSAILDELARRTRLSREDLEGGKRDRTPGPEERGGQTPVSGSVGRPVRRALQLLLEDPTLAGQIEQAELLAQVDVPGIGLLRDALDYFRDHPDHRASQLLESWRDTDRGRALDEVAAAPLALDPQVLHREFGDAIAHLCQKVLRARAQALLKAARRRDLTTEEQQELDGLTRTLAGQGSQGSS